MKRAAVIGGLIAVPTVVSIVAPLPASAQTAQCAGAESADDCAHYGCPAGMTCVVATEDADVPCECVEN